MENVIFRIKIGINSLLNILSLMKANIYWLPIDDELRNNIQDTSTRVGWSWTDDTFFVAKNTHRYFVW